MRWPRGMELKLKLLKEKAKDLGGEIKIFKFRSFQKLTRFNPFFPNKLNVEKFNSLEIR
jgi:hypothetical protein